MSIERTVIGGFPRPSSSDSLEEAIRGIVDLQLDYGIDVITDGEQRHNMIQYFGQIPGLDRTNGSLKIVKKIEPMKSPENFYKIADYHMVKSILAGLNRKDVAVKVTVTGPITLGFSCALGGLKHYRNIRDERIYSDLSDALSPLAEKSIGEGAHVQIDEPGLSANYVSPKFAKKILNRFSSSLPDSALDEGKISIHVCGPIGDVLRDELLELDIGILSLAFSGRRERGNVNMVSRRSLEDNEKKLGAGFISNTVVEHEETALRRLTEIARRAGSENLAYVHPDCGFGSTPPENVTQILENMKKASDRFIDRSVHELP